MLTLLIYLLIFCLVAALVWYLIGMLPLPQPVRMIVIVVFCLIGLLWLLQFVGGLPGLGLHGPR